MSGQHWRGTFDTVILDRETYEQLYSGDEQGLDTWYAVEVPPWVCSGCGTEVRYLTAGGPTLGSHLIVVWPAPDDPNLVKLLRDGEKVVPYERSMGDSISYYEATPS